MKSNTLDAIADRSPAHRHRTKDRFATRPEFPRTSLHNHRNPNIGKTIVRSLQVGRENVSVNSLWINKIGNRVVGMARLVQDGPHSARIVLFRIDPEWCHTKVPLNLINSIQSFCKDHGQLNVILPSHIAPPWMLTLMNQHGFQCAKA